MPEVENMQEENYKNQITSSNEEVNKNISPEQIVETNQPEIQNAQLQTENMEVHKHPHHVTHKKNWKEYMLEFFMLFLAVFLGFIAENIREHIAEHNRAEEYAISLVQDLQHDTTAINVQRKSGRIYMAITDSLLNLSKKPLEGSNAAQF